MLGFILFFFATMFDSYVVYSGVIDTRVERRIFLFNKEKNSTYWRWGWLNNAKLHRCGNIFLHDLQLKGRKGVKYSFHSRSPMEQIYCTIILSMRKKKQPGPKYPFNVPVAVGNTGEAWILCFLVIDFCLNNSIRNRRVRGWGRKLKFFSKFVTPFD